MSSDVERWTPTGITEVDRAVTAWWPATMVPAQFKDRDGRVRIEDLALAAHWLYALDIQPTPNIPDVYVIHGRVGIMAALQRALIQRAGYQLEVVETTAERATVAIRHGTGKAHRVTVTMAEAERAGWTRRAKTDVPSNYELIPDRMLLARACTKAISLYAPGVLRGITAAAERVAELEDDDEYQWHPSAGLADDQGKSRTIVGPDVGSAGEVEADAASPAEPRVDPETRDNLRARLDWLHQRDATAWEDLRAYCRTLALPSLDGDRFTLAHAALLSRLITEATADAVPPDLYDDLPEASAEPEGYRYDPTDNLG